MKHEIQIMIDYVEGNLNISDFREEFLNNKKLKKLLAKKVSMEGYEYNNHNIYDYLYGQINPLKNNWNNVYSRYVVWFNIREFLSYKNKSFKDYTKYDDDMTFLIKMQPSWLDCVDDQGIFDKILEEMPKDVSKTKQIAWGKARIKELFRYDKTYPRWIQSPEWPIVNGKPLVFSHQKSAGKDDVRTYYYFYDPDTKEETVITQMY